MSDTTVIIDQPVTVVMPQDDSTVVAMVQDDNTVVVISPTGPQGAPAGQDIGWLLSGGVAAGESLALPPLGHGATFNAIYATTVSGVDADTVLTITQKRLGIVISSATITLTANANDFMAAIPSPGLVGLRRDVMVLDIPDPLSSQLTDLAVTLGSYP